MGFVKDAIGGLFGSSKQQSTSSSNPYEGLPQFVMDYYARDVGRADFAVDHGRAIRDHLARNPEQLHGLSPDEHAAVARILDEEARSQGMLDASVDALGGDRYMSDLAGGAAGALGGDRYMSDLAGGAADALGGERYKSAYTDDVVSTTLDGMRREAARNAAQRGGSEAAIGGMGGTRAGVADALAQQLSGMDMAQMEAKLRDEGHRFAVDAGFREADMREDAFRFGTDAGFREADMREDAFRFGTDAGFQEADILRGIAGDGLDFATTASQVQGAAGAQQRQINDANREAWRTADRDAHSWYTDIFNASRGLPATGGGTTRSTEPGPSAASQAMGLASSAAGIWAMLSDERLKEDIDTADGAIDKLRDVPAFEYRYKEGYGHTPQRTSGLMAQDLERSGITGAVREVDGVKMVDPYPVLATIVQAVRELDDRTRPQEGLGG